MCGPYPHGGGQVDPRQNPLHLNSGDWVESLTAIVEHWDGRFELVDFNQFVREYPFPEEDPITEEAHAEAVESLIASW